MDVKDKKKFDTMVGFLYESDMARYERIIKRQWILCIVLAVSLVTSIIYGHKSK